MLIHKEGWSILAVTLVALTAVVTAAFYWLPAAGWGASLLSLVFFGLVLQFFRNPVRTIAAADNHTVYAPADGRVCVIEQTTEDEYFKDKRLQVSIFMSPLNVHVNRNPVSGTTPYVRYHPGKYLVAWHPKSSTENERTTVVYDTGHTRILLRQIAGAVARRICCYVTDGQRVEQGQDMGFIKFGSRVDLFLPLDAQIMVKMDDVVKGNQTIIAKI